MVTTYSQYVIADLKPGDHLCCLYQTEAEHRTLLTPYLRQGLERGEKVIYIVDARSAEMIVRYLQDDGVAVQPYLSRGQLKIITQDDSYMLNGAFHPDRMIDLLRAETERARAEGYSALRVTGEMTWALRGLSGSEQLIEYESKLNTFFPDSQCLGLCQYDRRRFNPEVLLDVLATHPIAVVGTTVYDNFYYIPPAQFLGQDKYAATLNRWLKNLEEHKQVHEALRYQRDKLNSILNAMGDGVYIINQQLDIEYLNPAMEKELGPLAGRKCYQYFYSQKEACPECHIKDVLRGKAIRREWYTAKTAKTYDVLNTPLPNQDGSISQLAILRDITERKRAEVALQQSEANYRTLVESSPDGIVSLDMKGQIIDYNEGICRLLDYTREELKGKDGRQFLAKALPESMDYYSTLLRQGGPVEEELEVVRRDGQVIPIWVKVVPVYDPNGDMAQVVIYLRDITEHKKLDQLKDDFIGLVSHELRSPLTITMGALNTVLSEGEKLSPQEARQLIEDAAWGAEWLSHILENLLELARAQADKLLLNTEAINIRKAVEDTVKKVRRQTAIHQFAIDLPAKLPVVRADQLRLERVLYNLLENAVKYSPQGGEIRVFARPEKELLVIGVKDQGVGISREDQDKLFDPFQRIVWPLTSGIKGLGLGLVVCQRLVEAHHGRIWAESKLGAGSTFYFTLPLAKRLPVEKARAH